MLSFDYSNTDSTHTVAGSILLASHKSLGVKETPVRTIPDFVDDIGLKVDVQGARHVFARGCLREKRAEATIVGRRRAFKKTAIGLHSLVRIDRYIKAYNSRSNRARRYIAPLR